MNIQFSGKTFEKIEEQLPSKAQLNEKPMSLPRRVSNYANAIAKWTAAGQPKRTDAEVESILMLCRACSHFNGKSCKVCTCQLNMSQSGLVNKLRMATENCPKSKW